ncbi:unnamed protein product [Periconia digitata]|uniref:Rhodopsin domain-containing protein n=1 Tax=Periconia digitata TaxID=1303443 RepID=A0A9W4UJQ8_9PLEO|nr:unnamed protein product [Periconia digitata]
MVPALRTLLTFTSTFRPPGFAIMGDVTNTPGWSNDRGPQVVAVSSACIGLLSLAVGLRVYAQGLMMNPLKKWDTWFTIIAAVMAIAIGSLLIHSVTHFGLGKHTFCVIAEDPLPPDNLANIFKVGKPPYFTVQTPKTAVNVSKFGYVQITIQAACLMFVKLAILSLYVRLFGMMRRDKLFTWGVYILFTFSVLLGVGSVIEFICNVSRRMCSGIEYTSCSRRGPRVAEQKVTVAIMLLPARILWGLQLPMRKKIGLGFTFRLGIFVSVTNVVRVSYYAKITVGGDIAWDNIDAMLWTIVQMCFAIVAACIPPSAPLLRVCMGSRENTMRGKYRSRLGSNSREETILRTAAIHPGSRESHQLDPYAYCKLLVPRLSIFHITPG